MPSTVSELWNRTIRNSGAGARGHSRDSVRAEAWPEQRRSSWRPTGRVRAAWDFNDTGSLRPAPFPSFAKGVRDFRLEGPSGYRSVAGVACAGQPVRSPRAATADMAFHGVGETSCSGTGLELPGGVRDVSAPVARRRIAIRHRRVLSLLAAPGSVGVRFRTPVARNPPCGGAVYGFGVRSTIARIPFLTCAQIVSRPPRTDQPQWRHANLHPQALAATLSAGSSGEAQGSVPPRSKGRKS